MKYTVIHLDEAQRKAIRAADVRKWPAGWALTVILGFRHSLAHESYDCNRVQEFNYYANLAWTLRSNLCIAATLAYPEVAR